MSGDKTRAGMACARGAGAHLQKREGASLNVLGRMRRRDHRDEEPEHALRVARRAADRVAQLLLGAQCVEEWLVHEMLEQRDLASEGCLVWAELPIQVDRAVLVSRVLADDRPHSRAGGKRRALAERRGRDERWRPAQRIARRLE